MGKRLHLKDLPQDGPAVRVVRGVYYSYFYQMLAVNLSELGGADWSHECIHGDAARFGLALGQAHALLPTGAPVVCFTMFRCKSPPSTARLGDIFRQTVAGVSELVQTGQPTDDNGADGAGDTRPAEPVAGKVGPVGTGEPGPGEPPAAG